MADTTTTPPGQFDWIAQLLTGGADLANARGSMNDAQRAAGMADPWAPYRSQFQQRLMDFEGNGANNPMDATQGTNAALGRINALMDDPNSITSMPGYQYGLDQSLEAVNRGAGASGLLNSGNRLMALQDRGQGYARQAYQDQFSNLMQLLQGNLASGNQMLNAQGQGFNQLAGLAGVNAGSPTAAAQALLNGRQNQQANLGAGIGGIANGAGGALSVIQKILSGGGTSLGGGGNSAMDANWLENMFPGGSSGDISAGLSLDPGADWSSLFAGMGGP